MWLKLRYYKCEPQNYIHQINNIPYDNKTDDTSFKINLT